MCVGRCKRLFYCLCGGGGTRAPSSSVPIPDEAPPSRLRGCGQKEEVKLRGGVCRLRKGGGASGSGRANEDLVNRFSLAEVQNCSRLREGARVSKRANEGFEKESAVCEEQSGTRGVLGVASKRANEEGQSWICRERR